MTPHQALEGWQSVESGPFFEIDADRAWSQAALPRDYFEVAKLYGGREGFLGRQYLRLYRLEELRHLNEAYQISLCRPDLVVFASDGYGEGFAFYKGSSQLLNIPLIPIPVINENIDSVAPDFNAFAQANLSEPAAALSQHPVGQELHLKQPLCFGGDWNDEKNLVWVTPPQHAELVRYWNRIYRDVSRQKG